METGSAPPLVVIAGPTASGKTGLGIAVALATGAEIVGADSMQIYRGLDIGTAKPSPDDRRAVLHHLIDVAEPDEPFDAARYRAEADRAIADIAARGRRAVVVGGTGLYIRALLYGLHGAPAPSAAVRRSIRDRAEREGWPAVHGQLAAIDPETAGRLHPNDGVRILRALEVFEGSGVPISQWHRDHGFSRPRYPALILGVDRPRRELYQRIDERVDRMVAAGFLAEVERLLEAGFDRRLKPLQGLGYRRMAAHLNGELSFEEAVDKTKTDTRRFAKRQRTWFNREPGLLWVPPDAEAIIGRVNQFLHL